MDGPLHSTAPPIQPAMVVAAALLMDASGDADYNTAYRSGRVLEFLDDLANKRRHRPKALKRIVLWNPGNRYGLGLEPADIAEIFLAVREPLRSTGVRLQLVEQNELKRKIWSLEHTR